jgi:predicted nucleotidyltransferase
VAAVSAQLPEAVRTTLNEFTAAAQEAFAEDLLSVVLFGSAAEGRLRATSDVNVVLVLRRVDPRKLEAIGEAYRFAHAAIRLSAMFILESEIGVTKDAFAVKLADIIARHQVLYGPGSLYWTDDLTRSSLAPPAAGARQSATAVA